MSFFKQKTRKLKPIKSTNQSTNESEMEDAKEASSLIDKLLSKNIANIKAAYGNSSDLGIRQMKSEKGFVACIAYIDGLVDKKVIEGILEDWMYKLDNLESGADGLTDEEMVKLIQNSFLPFGEIGIIHTNHQMESAILNGEALLIMDGYSLGIQINTVGFKGRGVSESTTESVIRGPKEAFTETIRTNTAMVRRKIKDTSFRVEEFQVGRITKTVVSVVHLSGIANEKIVEEVRQRIQRIDIDSVLESSYIEELIEDETYTPFPTVFNTERPDVVAAGLLEGKVAIFIDGTPFVLIVPALFTQFFQSAEDYYQRWDIASMLRVLRVIAFFISILGPSLYIALTNFHQEMLPSTLLIDLAAQREGVPFPAVIEALIMEVTLEILREAGVRLPKTIGQTISIVGALVIGQTAVEAGIVSAAMVIVVSLTAISNFILPSFSMAISVRIIRFGFIIFAATFGLYGITLGLFILSLHLCSIRSFGVPYMTPIAPYVKEDQKDTLWRKPTFKRFTRPRLVNGGNIWRESEQTARNVQPGKRSEET
ncbi:Spore germination protein B1 [Bacillus sp. THAF10]|uniref:spore germination protein n=1 Tax=Bacillus sp. THAF10 TaxID=2587848 RepID=UPI001267E9B4|nr:spore germination protein [Bacillus sp. THAF10]QFT90625.1 Spore germination protein B1 [Bacillus sp. THAF10]